MSEKKFSVIKFGLDESVEYVPTSWLASDSKSVSFLSTKPKNFLKHKQTPDSAPDSAWPIWEVDVVKSYDSTEKADKRVLKYIKSSDIESSGIDETLTKKRGGRSSEVSSAVINPFPEPNSLIYSLNNVSVNSDRQSNTVHPNSTPRLVLASSSTSKANQTFNTNPTHPASTAPFIPPFSEGLYQPYQPYRHYREPYVHGNSFLQVIAIICLKL
ncbi:unnamed protein product [Orchesella dallaii]|uniref:Uncharacterized protein n=1 Tax=Orchesella dallaii TaxID=48710 RepID=A0ABP1QR81_9HEXA